MSSDQLANHQIIGLVLMLMGGVLVFLWAFFWMLDGLRYLLAALLLGVLGSFLLDWKISLIIWGTPVAGFIYFSLQQASYTEHFPVFSVPPIDTIHEKNGYIHHLHLRQWGSHFIIGIDYEQEVDGSVSRYKTRWKDRFTSRATAELELRRRFANWQRNDCMHR
jgi:hypothetical protein